MTPTRFRSHPPVHSPLPPRALLGSASTIAIRGDPRPALIARLRQWYRAQHVLPTDSGTTALQLAIRIARALKGGGPVALPAYSCFDLATAAEGADATITLYDLDPRSLAPDLDDLRRCLAEGARVVVVAPLFGVPVDWAALTEETAAHGAILIEDAAQGFGASWDGQPLGTLASLSVLSFGRGKGWSAGNGGALLFRAPGPWTGLPDQLGDHPLSTELSALGGAIAQALLAHPALYWLPRAVPGLHLGETRYHAPHRERPLPRGAAAILLESRAAAESEAAQRRLTGRWYRHALPVRPWLEPIIPPHRAVPGWLRAPIRVDFEGFDREEAREARRLGVMPGYPSGLDALAVVRRRLTPEGSTRRWPGAETLVRTLLTLPTHSLLRVEERRDVVRLFERYRRPRWASARS